jgi:hypothetical protein
MFWPAFDKLIQLAEWLEKCSAALPFVFALLPRLK